MVWGRNDQGWGAKRLGDQKGGKTTRGETTRGETSWGRNVLLPYKILTRSGKFILPLFRKLDFYIVFIYPRAPNDVALGNSFMTTECISHICKSTYLKYTSYVESRVMSQHYLYYTLNYKCLLAGLQGGAS